MTAQQPATQVATVAPERQLLDTYCVTCHNARLHTAGLALDGLDVADVGKDAQTWEKVLRKVRTGAMPPPGRRRPDGAVSANFAAHLETMLDRAALINPNPGSLPDHRLNRAEYGNAVRDLLAMDIDTESLLPGDDSAYGFDNIADVLSVTPALLDRYLSAARTISRLAIGDPLIGPVVETFEVPFMLAQESRVSEDLPFGSRGGILIRYSFPLDGEYVIKIRLKRGGAVEAIQGLAEPSQIDVRLDGVRVKQFTVGGKGKGPQSNALTADEGLEVRVPVKAGARKVGISFVQNIAEPEGILRPRTSVVDRGFGKDDGPGVGSVEIGGPFNVTGPGDTSSRQKIFVCRPTRTEDQEVCAKKILSTLARRAYRRPVTAADVQPLLAFYRAGQSQRGFEAGIERALRRILVDPEFLFRTERDPANVAPDTAYRISDLQLASRLSFFLWSSIPDDELMDVAARGRLKEPGVLEAQVRRMLADARSNALVSNFAGQWLYLRKLKAMTPDPLVFPDFDEELRQGFQRETELFVGSMLREDRGVVDLLSANYTFVNERLARHYGIPNIYGSHFRRVAVGNERGGLFGQGSLLFVTSYGNRTSPVLRGKWILENIFNAPPPPPPADVPALKENDEVGGKALTVRQRLEEHRKNPVCASCHSQMDPLGFALENFDALGKWRTSEADAPIDASGVLSNGTKFEGLAGLREVLLSRRAEFVTTVTEKLLTYALGRGLNYYDAPAVRAITREAGRTDSRWSSLILGIVESRPFQMRRSLPSTAQTTLGVSRH